MMPSCDQIGVPIHFHSSTTSGSASMMSLRILLRVSPRQSPSSAILFEMSPDAGWPWLAPDFFMSSSWKFQIYICRATLAHAEAPAEPRQFFLLHGREDRELLHQPAQVAGERLLDGPPALRGQIDEYAPPVPLDALAPHQAALFQLVDEQDDVGAAGQELWSQMAGLQRPQVEQRFEQAELVAGEAVFPHRGFQARREGGRAADQLDERVQGPDFARLSPVVCPHESSCLLRNHLVLTDSVLTDLGAAVMPNTREVARLSI